MAPSILRRTVLLLVLLSLIILHSSFNYFSSTCCSFSCAPQVASNRRSSRRYWGEEEQLHHRLLVVQTGRVLWADAANTAKSKPKDSYSSTKNRKRDEPKKEDGNSPPRQRSAKSRIPKDLYELLEVPRSATAKKIKSAYRKAARKYHPDVNQDDPLAKERFQAINKAYAVLQDPDKRSVYDQTGMTDEEMAAGGGGPQPGAAGGFRGRGGGGPSPFQSFTGTHFGEDYQWGFGRPPPQQWGRRDNGEPPFGGFASQKARGSPSAGQQQQQRERKFSFESMFTTKNSATQPSSKNKKPQQESEEQGEKSSGGMFGSLFGSLFGSSTKRTVPADDNEGDARSKSSHGKSRSDQRSQRTTSPGAEERPRSSTSSSSNHKRGTAGRNGGGESADSEGKPKFHSKPSREDLHEKFNTKKNGNAEFDETDAPPKEFFFQQGNNGPDDMDPSSNPHFARWFAKKFGQGPMGGDMGGGGGGGPFGGGGGGGGGGFSSKPKSSPKGTGGGGSSSSSSSSSSSKQSKKSKPKREEDYSSRTSQPKTKETKKPKASPSPPEKKPQPAGTVWRFDRSLFESACLAAGRGGAAKRCVLLYGASSTFQSGEALFREVSAELHRDLHTPLFFVDRHEIRNVTEAVKASVRDIIREESLELKEEEDVLKLQWDRARWCASHAPVGDHRLAKTAPALVGEYCLWMMVHRPQKSSLKFAAVGKFPDLPKTATTTTTTTKCATKATAGDDECDIGSSVEQQRPLPGANAVKSLRNAKDVLQAVQRLADGSDVSWAHVTTA